MIFRWLEISSNPSDLLYKTKYNMMVKAIINYCMVRWALLDIIWLQDWVMAGWRWLPPPVLNGTVHERKMENDYNKRKINESSPLGPPVTRQTRENKLWSAVAGETSIGLLCQGELNTWLLPVLFHVKLHLMVWVLPEDLFLPPGPVQSYWRWWIMNCGSL